MALSPNTPLPSQEVVEVRVVTVHLPEAYIEAIDQLVRKRLYPNRAEAIRMAIRDFIMEEAMRGE
jgi:Arc/MetJ-type ribon-helix-helix transcriptional regulator